MPITGKVLLENITENKNQWLALREGKVSSSNIAVIAGLSRFKSPLELWAEWTGKVKNEFIGNDATELGTVLEPFVAKLFEKRTCRPVEHVNKLYQHKDVDWAIASPDYFIKPYDTASLDNNEILEIKTGSYRQLDKWKDGKAPDEYVVQVYWQLGVLGLDKGVISPFLGLDVAGEVNDVEIEFDKEFFSLLLEKADNFRQLVKHDIPPEASVEDSSIIRKLYDRHGKISKLTSAESITVSHILAEINAHKKVLKTYRDQIHIIDTYRDQIRIINDKRKKAENSLKLMMRDSDVFELIDGRKIKLARIKIEERISSAYEYDRLTLPKELTDGE